MGALDSRPATQLGTLLRALRLARDLSQADLAARLGRAQSVVSRWERGVLEPTPLDAVALCAALAVPLEALLVGVPAVRGRRRTSRRDGSRDLALGRAVREMRAELGLSPVGVARRAGLTPRRLRRIELGQDPSLGELAGLSRGLGVAAGALMGPKLDGLGDRTTVPAGPKPPPTPTAS